MTYQLSVVLTKISILLGYIRVFQHSKIQLASKITIGLVVIYWLYGFLSIMLGCKPVSFFWDQSTVDGYCILSVAFWLSYAALNMVTDVIIIIIPMPALSTLHLARKAKLWLISVFALGSV